MFGKNDDKTKETKTMDIPAEAKPQGEPSLPIISLPAHTAYLSATEEYKRLMRKLETIMTFSTASKAEVQRHRNALRRATQDLEQELKTARGLL